MPTDQGDEGFDPSHPPVITYRVVDSMQPDTVCNWRWWGPEPAWDVLGYVLRRGNGLVLERVQVVPHGWFDEPEDEGDPDAPTATTSVSPSLLKAIPLTRLMAQVHGDLLRRASQTVADEQWARHVREVAASAQLAPSSRTGRPSLSHDLLREVALAYLKEAEVGRGLTLRLAVKFDRPQATIRDWIRAARREGFLSEAKPGRLDAAPGWRLLDELHSEVTGLEGTGFDTTAEVRAAAVIASSAAAARLDPSDQPPF